MGYDKVQEQKRHVNKADQFYWCDLLHRDEGYMVLKYDVVKDSHIGPVDIPAGSMTIAHYREGTAYVLWEMYDPGRKLIGYCYHLSLPPEIGPKHVEYLDLLLDLWFDPAGNLTVLDEDELQQAISQGKISGVERKLLDCEREQIPQLHDAIIANLWHPPQGLKKL